MVIASAFWFLLTCTTVNFVLLRTAKMSPVCTKSTGVFAGTKNLADGVPGNPAASLPNLKAHMLDGLIGLVAPSLTFIPFTVAGKRFGASKKASQTVAILFIKRMRRSLADTELEPVS